MRKRIILFILATLLIVTPVLALLVDTGYSGNGTGGAALKRGVKIQINNSCSFDLYGVNFMTYGAPAYTTWNMLYIQNSSRSDIANTSTSFLSYGNFSTPVHLTNGTIYYLVVDRAGAAYTCSYEYPLAIFPYNLGYLTILNGSNDGADVGDYFTAIMSFNIDNINCGGGAGNTSSMVIITPNASGTANNTNIDMQFDCSGNAITLYFDNVSSPTTMVRNLSSNYTYRTNVSIEGNYYFKGFCKNTTTNVSSPNSSVYTWRYDVTFPTITIPTTNKLFTSNNETLQGYSKYKSLAITFTDNLLLYAYSINITKGGMSVYQIENQSMVGAPTIVNFSTTLNATNWSSGVYNVEIIASDAHTANHIPDYQVTKKKSSITFKTEYGNNIKIESRETSTITTTKLDDRYTFNISFDNKNITSRTFDVKSDLCPLTYLPDSKFKAHFVSICSLKTGGNWIDFEGVTMSTPFVTKMDDYHYQVYFSLMPPDVVFQSIGGLNIFTANYTFYHGNYSYNNETWLVETPYNYYLNLTNDSALVQNFTAQLIFNGVNASTATKTTGSGFVQFNITLINNVTGLNSFSWNISIQQNNIRYNFSINGTQQIQNFSVAACGGATNTSTIYMPFMDELNPSTALAPQNYEYTLTYSSLPDMSIKRNISNSSSGSNITICISPSTATLYVDLYAKYNISTGFSHRYFLRNATINSTPQTYYLYNPSNTTSYSILKLTTRKASDYSYYKNVIAALQRYYVGEGVWRTIQMDESGEYGVMNFNIMERITDYRITFIERESTETLKTTQSMKFVCSSGLCDLTYLLSRGLAAAAAQTFNYTLANQSKAINFTWSDSGLAAVTTRLYIWKNTITGIQTICDTTQVGNAGIINCDATLYYGNIKADIFRNGVLQYGRDFDFKDNDLSFYLPTGEGGFWALLIMVLCILFGLFSPVGSIISGVVGLVIIYLLGIFSPLTFTGVAVAALIGAIIGFKVRA